MFSVISEYPQLPVDEQTLLLDFLPSITRTIQHNGVTIDGLRYYDVALNMYISDSDESGKSKEFLFRRDPRNISKIWFYDPKLKRYFPIPFANQAMPEMSIWEYREVRSRIANKGDKYINEQQVLDGLTEMREMVAESAQRTKKARRQAERQKTHKASKPIIETKVETKVVAPVVATSNLLALDDESLSFGEVD